MARLSHPAQCSLKRVVDKLHTQIVEILDREEAPFRVCRWVAWGEWHQDRALRLWLALYLRREPDLQATKRSASGWSWPKDHLLAAGLRQLRGLPQYTRLVQLKLVQPEPPDNARLYTLQWAETWGVLQRELGSVDKHKFFDQVQQVAASRKRRKARKQLKLGPEVLAAVEALDTLKRLVVRGGVSLDELTSQQKERKK